MTARTCPRCGKPKAAVYARISDDQKGERLGVTDQLEDCWAKVADEGWCTCTADEDTYQDNDIGAFRGKHRPGYESLLTALDGGRYKFLVARDDGRFARNMRQSLALIDLVEARRVQVHTLWTDRWDLSTAAGRKRLRDSASDAQYEAERTGERVSRARLRDAKAGKPNMGGRYRPWGFEEDRITHHPTEAAEVRDAARRLLAGESINSICKRYGKYQDALKRALRSPRVAGYREYKGQLFPATWEPILDADTWAGVKAALDTRKDGRREPGGSFARKHLLSGILQCGLCGERANGGSLEIKGKGRVAGYRCQGCGNTRRSAEPLERYVVDQLLRRHPIDADRPEVDPALRAAVQGFEARLAEADELWKLGTWSPTVYAGHKTDLEARLAEARGKLAEAQEKAAATPGRFYASGPGEHGLHFGDMAVRRRQWDALDLRQKRAMIVDRISAIVLHRAVVGRRFDRAAVEIIGVDGERWADLPGVEGEALPTAEELLATVKRGRRKSA